LTLPISKHRSPIPYISVPSTSLSILTPNPLCFPGKYSKIVRFLFAAGEDAIIKKFGIEGGKFEEL
jgi:hypothetical protein